MFSVTAPDFVPPVRRSSSSGTITTPTAVVPAMPGSRAQAPSPSSSTSVLNLPPLPPSPVGASSDEDNVTVYPGSPPSPILSPVPLALESSSNLVPLPLDFSDLSHISLIAADHNELDKIVESPKLIAPEVASVGNLTQSPVKQSSSSLISKEPLKLGTNEPMSFEVGNMPESEESVALKKLTKNDDSGRVLPSYCNSERHNGGKCWCTPTNDWIADFIAFKTKFKKPESSAKKILESLNVDTSFSGAKELLQRPELKTQDPRAKKIEFGNSPVNVKKPLDPNSSKRSRARNKDNQTPAVESTESVEIT